MYANSTLHGIFLSMDAHKSCRCLSLGTQIDKWSVCTYWDLGEWPWIYIINHNCCFHWLVLGASRIVNKHYKKRTQRTLFVWPSPPKRVLWKCWFLTTPYQNLRMHNKQTFKKAYIISWALPHRVLSKMMTIIVDDTLVNQDISVHGSQSIWCWRKKFVCIFIYPNPTTFPSFPISGCWLIPSGKNISTQ